MPLFNWTDSKYSVNIKELDQQHKWLVDIINQLYDAKQDKKDQEVLGKVLDELVDYTKTHFKKEEKLMKDYGYPDYTAHKSEHDSLTKKALDMRKKYYSGEANMTIKIGFLLKNWLSDHILVVDKKYSPYLNKKGVA